MRKRATLSILAVLSVDLLIQVLDKLADPYDRKAWRLVCKGFLRAETLQRKQLKVFRHESLPLLLKRYGSVELLDLSVCPRVDDRTILACFGGGGGGGGWGCHRRLRTVNLSRASAVRWSGLEVLVKSCPMLEALDLSYCYGVGDREVAAVAEAKGLKVLLVTRCVGVTDVGLARVAVGCGGLERLGLKWCMEITDIGMELLAKKCTSLKILDISYLKVTNRSLRAISFLGKLEVLSMVGCSGVDDAGLKFLAYRNCSLRVLDVSRCDNVSSLGLASVIEGQDHLQNLYAGHCVPEELVPLFLSKLNHQDKNLKILKLDGFQVSESSLQTLGSHLKNLVEIGLSKCKGVTDEGIHKLVTRCTNLRAFDLTCCHFLTDRALSAIADACEKLLCLKLESCTLITEKGLDQIGASCGSLKEIDLTDCGINDIALKSLSRCSNLMVLKLGLCSNITDKGLIYVGSNCKMLRELDLYRCTEISDDGLAALATGCKKLKKLNLCYCSQITDQGMKYLSSLQELSDLELRRLSNISSAGITALAIGCRSLVELDLKRCYSVDDTSLWALAHHCQNLRQINVSYCPITDVGLCVLLGNLRCLQDVKLVHLSTVSVEGLELALRASWNRLKKVKLLTGLRYLLSQELVQILLARRCRIRWVDKPLIIS